MKEKFDVFLCHNSSDKPAVRDICNKLEKRGLHPWLDEQELLPGQSWQQELEKQIDQIQAAAVLVGPEEMRPVQKMKQEALLRLFTERGRPIIPVILPNVTKTPSLPMFLENMHWVDFRKAQPDPLELLIRGITGVKSVKNDISKEKLGSGKETPGAEIERNKTKNMSDIFISYASSDKKIAKSLAEVLGQQGWSVWWDINIPPGRTFYEVIEEALAASRCVIVLWSGESVKSHWVNEEAIEASRRKILVPALIEDVSIPLGFKSIQSARLIDWKGEMPHPEADRLIDAVEKILGIPRSAKSETERVDSKTVEDEISKHENIEGKAVEEKAELQLHLVDQVDAKSISFETTDDKILEQKPDEHRPEAADSKKPPKKQKVKETTGVETDGNNQTSSIPKLWIIIGTVVLLGAITSFYLMVDNGWIIFKTRPIDTKGMVKIPGRPFIMGTKDFPDERPPHQVTLRSYYIDEHEVTNREFQEFVDYQIKEGIDFVQPLGWNNNKYTVGEGNYPVTGVTWYSARDYSWWRGKRLPTETEWERAARGKDDRKIAYIKSGGPIPEVLAKQQEEKFYDITQVKSIIWQGPEDALYDRNDFNVYDMSGNAWEWVEDWYDAYPGADEEELNEKYGEIYKVVRGGATEQYSRKTRTSDRNYAVPYSQLKMIGFRCAMDE